MKRRSIVILGLVTLLSIGAAGLGVSAVLRGGDQAVDSARDSTALAPLSPGQLARLAAPSEGAYTGAYIEFGELEDEVTLEKIDAFADLVGRRQAIVAFSNFWGRGRFPGRQVRVIASSGAVPLVLWNPWDDRDNAWRTRYKLDDISVGRWDAYIDAWSKEARAFGKPLLVAWGLEMNGTWFPWSGAFHGGGTPVGGAASGLYQGPEAFKRAYRHVVERVRAGGAANVSWLFHTNNASIPKEPWNRMASYYPGSDVVDWLAMSAYGKQFPQQDWVSVEKALVGPYQELAAVDPGKPVLIAEWGIGEFPREGDKGAWIGEAFTAMEQRMPRLRGAVFWHERWQNKDLSYSNLRAGSSLGALTAYRQGVARPFWRAEPGFLAAAAGRRVAGTR
jgi:hypothetical protein